MAIRTSAGAVKDAVLDDYGPRRDGTLPDLAGFIRRASLVVDRVAVCAAAKGKALSTAELQEIECELAAHFYLSSDQAYASRSTSNALGAASGTYQGKTGKGLEGTKHGMNALLLDASGCLAAIDKRQTAGAAWLGKTPREAIPWYDRE